MTLRSHLMSNLTNNFKDMGKFEAQERHGKIQACQHSSYPFYFVVCLTDLRYVFSAILEGQSLTQKGAIRVMKYFHLYPENHLAYMTFSRERCYV